MDWQDQYTDTEENRQKFKKMADSFTWTHGRGYCVVRYNDNTLGVSLKSQADAEIIYESDLAR